MGFITSLEEVDRHQISLVGGKAANLGELKKIAGVLVPGGFCVTTDAYAVVMAGDPELAGAVDQLDATRPGDTATVAALSAGVRSRIERAALPVTLVDAVLDFLFEESHMGKWAVRSSATAEDMPNTSFAGLHDSYLGLQGFEALLDGIRRCWASLFTDRAVVYRQRNRIGHHGTRMAVIVQRMVPAEASGVMFTADPVSGDRTVTAIEACEGTGEALVSGGVVPQGYRLREGEILGATGGEDAPLSENNALALAALGRRIEAHFGRPQDIEWCLLDGAFQIVQSRPITTLFPIPARDDDKRRVYLSVGHQQMMTDPIRPLGLSVWQMLAARPMYEAGGHLFVDITEQLASPASRAALLGMLGRDPLICSAVDELLTRNFVGEPPQQDSISSAPANPTADPTTASALAESPDPAVIADLIERSEIAVAEARRRLEVRSGTALFDFIADDLAALKRQLSDPQSMQALMAGINAAWWLGDRLDEWLGETGIVDTLSQSVANNITSQMGLDLLNVADAIRPCHAAVSFLRRFDAADSLSNLRQVDGGNEALAAINGYLARYGARCAGEIDITRTRWREQPAVLVPMILAHIDRFKPGEAERRFQAGLARAKAAERDVLKRLRTLPEGAAKAAQTKDAIDRMRAFVGYREYPKYGWVCRLDVHKQALLREARQLVDKDVLKRIDDIFYLRFDEVREVVRTGQANHDLIAMRRAEFANCERLKPPRVLTSRGEALFGGYGREDLPANAIPGLGVSTGIVEGRARVITDMAARDIAAGDILVTTYTDPSWTPLFMTVAGLVTEAGGQMSHGAVIAREYGLPAVVAVKDATRRIQDGDRIRIDGSGGVITILHSD